MTARIGEFRSTELVGSLCGVEAARASVESGKMLPRSGLANPQLVCCSDDGSGFYVGDQSLKLTASGTPLRGPAEVAAQVPVPHANRSTAAIHSSRPSMGMR